MPSGSSTVASGGSRPSELNPQESDASSLGGNCATLSQGTGDPASGATAGLIAVVGGESTGKSTLAAALADDLPALLVPETLRTWVARCGRVPRADEQRDVMLEHAAAESRALEVIGGARSRPAGAAAGAVAGAEAGGAAVGAGLDERSVASGAGVVRSVDSRPRWVVSDGGVLMTAVYSLLYYDDASLLVEAVELSRRARLVVWCGADFPWVPDDGQRDGPHMRDRAQEILGEVLASADVPWLQVQGRTRARLQQVRRRLTSED